MALTCADTNFLYAVYDPAQGSLHVSALTLFADLFEPTVNVLGLPWPIMYETLNTRLARRPESLARMNEHFTRLRLANRLLFMDDQPYRLVETESLFAEVGRGAHYRPLSLVDRIVRRLIAVHSPKIEALVSINPGDFVDICASRSCQILAF